MSDVELQANERPARGGRRLAAAVGAVALVGGGLFAAVSLAGDDANSPEEPVRELLSAIEDGDALGALEQVVPDERDALREPLVELVDELNRLDVLAADLGDISGVEVAFEEIELASEVDGDLARVTVTGGTASFALDQDELPIGGFLRELLGDNAPADERETSELDGGEDFLVTVERGGSWYVSLGYTLAEQARVEDGTSLGDLGEGVAPTGADSPEEAVEAFLRAAAGLQIETVLGLLSPDLAPLRRYAELFMAEAEQGVAGASGVVDLTVEGVALEADVDGDEALVRVSDLDVSGTLGGQPFDSDALAEMGSQFGVPASGLPAIGDGEQPDVGVVVVRVDGKWFVSPIRTVLDGLTATLRTLERDDLDQLRQLFSEGFGGLLEGTLGSVLEGAPLEQ